MREVLKKTGKEALARSYGHAKMFGEVGLLYAGSEAVIERVRAKHDVYNSALAGCFSGGVLARGSGPSGAAIGCGTFAAFSVAMDKFMGMH
jgi:import inner membrane translocase subunit TIM22